MKPSHLQRFHGKKQIILWQNKRTFFVGEQMINQAEAYGQRVVMFVPYFSIENLATLVYFDTKDTVKTT
jgi:hypothetical protein